MAGYDPNLVNQALAMQGSAFRVPASGADLLAEQDAAMAQQQARDAALAGPSVLPPEQVMSVQPAAEENMSDFVSEPLMSYAVEPPAALMRQPSAGPQQPVRTPPTQSTGMGGTNPVPGMLKDATARRTEAEAEMKRQELAGDVATADQQQAAADLGAARAATAEDVARVQERSALEGQTYQDRLSADQDSYEKATSRTEAEQRELSKFIGEYEPKDRRTTSRKMMSALAVGLAALGDQKNLAAGLNIGLNVQTNHAANALSMIQRGIDRDLEQQRMMLDNKRTALAAKNTELGQARERFGDRMDAMKLARAMKLDQAAQEVEALKTRGMAPEAIAVADQTIAALQADRANTLLGVSQQRFQQHFGDEQRLKMVQAQQAAAAARARQPMSTKDALELEGKALDNAKKRAELEGGLQKPLTAEQLKRQSLFKGKDEAARFIASAVASGDAAPGVIGRNAPALLRSDEGDQMDTAIAAMEDVLLRDESGASISEGDKASKRAAWGLNRGEAARRRGLRMMLDEYNARLESVGLPTVEPIVRRGAR